MIASALDYPHPVLLSSTDVFWSNVNGFTLVRAPLDGGVPILLAPQRALGLALDASDAYWVSDDGKVQRVSHRGGEPVLVASLPPSSTWRGGAVTPAEYFVADYSLNQIWRVPFDGNAPHVFAANEPVPTSVAVDDTHVYWTDEAGLVDGAVKRAPRSGGPIQTLAAPEVGAHGLALDATHAYFSNISADTVKRVPLDGGAVEVLASGQAQPAGVAVDATHVFWTVTGSTGPGTVMAASIRGGESIELAAGEPGPFAIAVDEHCVYWTTHGFGGWGAGTIKRVAKPPE